MVFLRVLILALGISFGVLNHGSVEEAEALMTVKNKREAMEVLEKSRKKINFLIWHFH